MTAVSAKRTFVFHSFGGQRVARHSQVMGRGNWPGYRRIRGNGRRDSHHRGGDYPPHRQQFQYCILERCQFDPVGFVTIAPPMFFNLRVAQGSLPRFTRHHGLVSHFVQNLLGGALAGGDRPVHGSVITGDVGCLAGKK